MASTLVYFILTVLVEFAVAGFFMKKEYLKLFAYVFLINLFTWPLTTVFIQMIWTNFIGNLSLLLFAPLIVEACVILAEGFLLKQLLEMKYSKALIISLSANIASIIIGLVASALQIV